MKHFIIEITFTAPPERMAEIRPRHREHLQTGFDRGILLFSGPKEDMTGGLVMARVNTLSEVEEFFAKDPYALNGIATYRFIEFKPVFFQPMLEEWMQTQRV